MKNFLLLVCIVLFFGCTDTESWYENKIQPIRIEGVKPIKYYQIDVVGVPGKVLVDSATRIEYIVIGFGAYGAGLTPRIDPLGKPILYTEEFPE